MDPITATMVISTVITLADSIIKVLDNSQITSEKRHAMITAITSQAMEQIQNDIVKTSSWPFDSRVSFIQTRYTDWLRTANQKLSEMSSDAAQLKANTDSSGLLMGLTKLVDQVTDAINGHKDSAAINKILNKYNINYGKVDRVFNWLSGDKNRKINAALGKIQSESAKLQSTAKEAYNQTQREIIAHREKSEGGTQSVYIRKD